jgi:hypothetical protein
MTFTKLLGIGLLALPALSQASSNEMEARAGNYAACAIKNADGSLSGSFHLLKTSADPKWASMISIGFQDADGKALYRFGAMGIHGSSQARTFQTFVLGSNDASTEELGLVAQDEAVPFRLKWKADGWITAQLGATAERRMFFSLKPSRVMAIVSGASARLDLLDPATLACEDRLPDEK